MLCVVTYFVNVSRKLRIGFLTTHKNLSLCTNSSCHMFAAPPEHCDAHDPWEATCCDWVSTSHVRDFALSYSNMFHVVAPFFMVSRCAFFLSWRRCWRYALTRALSGAFCGGWEMTVCPSSAHLRVFIPRRRGMSRSSWIANGTYNGFATNTGR